MLDEVLELAVDEEIQVREAALDCLLNMTHLFDDGMFLLLRVRRSMSVNSERILGIILPFACNISEQYNLSFRLCITLQHNKKHNLNVT